MSATRASPSRVEILCGPPGSGKTTAALRRYAEQVRREGEDTALLLLPSARVVRQARAWLLSAGALPGLVDPRLFTFPQLASLILNANHECVTPVPPTTQELLLRGVIDDLAGEERLPALGGVSDLPGFIRAMFELIADLKRAAVEPRQFCSALTRAGLTEAWHREIGGLYCGYQWRLVCLRAFDAEGLFWWARAVLARGGRRPLTDLKLMVVDGFTDFTTTQLEVLQLLAQGLPETLITLGYSPDDSREGLADWHRDTLDRLRRHLPAAVLTEQPPAPAQGPLAHLRTRLFSPLPSEPGPSPMGKVRLLECPSPGREVREVLRRVKSLLVEGRAQPGEIAIVFRSLAERAETVRQLAQRMGVPIHLDAPRSPAASHAVQALLHAYETVAGGYRREDVLTLLRSSYLTCAAGVPATSPEEMALAASEARIIEGRQQWFERLAACRARLRRRIAHGERPVSEDAPLDPNSSEAKLQAVCAAEQLLPRLFDLLPRPEAALTLAERVAETRALLAETQLWANTARPQIAEYASDDLRALDRLEQGLDELEHARQGRLAPAGLSAAAYLSLLRRLLENLAEQPAPPAGDRVAVIEARTARQLRFRVCFVAGLIEGEFPRRPSEEPLFSREQLARLESAGVALERRRTPEAEEPLLFHAAVSAATEELRLSYAATDSDGRPLQPSHYLAAVRRLFSADLDEPPVRLSDVVPQLHELADPGEVVDRAVFDLAAGEPSPAPTAYHALLRLPEGSAVVRRVAAGIRLEDTRRSPRPTGPYVGLLQTPAVVADLADRFGGEYRFSSTALSRYAQCPFAFLCDYALGLTTLAPPELLDRRQVGSVRHRVLRDFCRARLERRPDRPLVQPGEEAEAAEEIGCLVDREFARFADSEGVAEPALWALERERARADLARWVEVEALRFGAQTPLDAEVSFGWAEPDRVELPDRPDILLAGRIDRVNLAEGPTFVLLDYKLGQLPTVGAIKDGIDLQFPVYAIGAPRVLPRLAEVPCGSWHYWSLSGNLKLLPSAARPVGVDSVREVLASVLPRAAQYVDGLRDGWCSVQGQSCPQYCDFRDVCRITPWMRLKESDAEPEEDGA